jgi:hypothetical protein
MPRAVEVTHERALGAVITVPTAAILDVGLTVMQEDRV